MIDNEIIFQISTFSSLQLIPKKLSHTSKEYSMSRIRSKNTTESKLAA